MTAESKWTIEFEVQVDPLPADIQKLHAAAEIAMRQYRERPATITISVVDDKEMKKIHKQFLKKSSTTDVLSFDLSDTFQRRRVFALAVNAEMAARQARRRDHSVEAEIALYIIHGLLHHLGFDDDTPEHARRMHRAENTILQKAGFGRVYFDSDL